MTSKEQAFKAINTNRRHLTRQQFRTLWGQAKAGNPDAAMKGLQKLMARRRGTKKEGVEM